MTESASSRPDGPYPIRPIEEDEFDSFMEVDEHAFHGSPHSESGRRMGVSESRICQLHGRAIDRLRDRLASQSDD